MLKYKVGHKQIEDNFLNIEYTSFTLHQYSQLVDTDEYLVTFECNEDIPFEADSSVNVSCDYMVTDDVLNNTYNLLEYYTARVVKVNHIDYSFSIAIKKNKVIETPNLIEEYEEDGLIYWQFSFDNIHTFLSTDESIDLILKHSGIYEERLEGLEYINSYTLRWTYNDQIPNIDEITNMLFNNRMYGVTFMREQFIFQQDSTSALYNTNMSIPAITITKPKMSLQIPIAEKVDVSLMKEININEQFVKDGIDNAINPIVDMEKRSYMPVNTNTRGLYTDVIKINFNLHFRDHSGDNWTVKQNDTWNCFKLFNGMSPDEDFYPYLNNNNQSDLLGCLGFTNKDVKYQKNVLKKSFLRLSYYNSMNEGNQSLLAYSTVYFDAAKLYSKYMSTYNMPIYINKNFTDDNSEYTILNGGKVDTEVKRNELNKYITIDGDETVEKYRISSQISVENKWLSDRTSEGFYVYLWVDNNNGIIPTDLYMKVELNHAGFGRTIPFMLPYNLPDTNGIGSVKSMMQIKTDWESGHGYTTDVYKKYSYIKLKYVYDKDNSRYVYYLDPERYGYIQGNILNINLYEARISFGV